MYSFFRSEKAGGNAPEKLLITGLILVFMLVTAVFVLLYSNRKLTQKNRVAQDNTRRVMLLCADIKSDVYALESSARGFILTRDSSYLSPYTSAMKGLRARSSELIRLNQSNTAQLRRSQQLSDVIKRKKDFTKKQILAVRSGTFKAARSLTMTGSGLRLSGRINTLLDSIRVHEYQTLNAGVRNTELSLKRTGMLTNTLGGLLAVTMFFGVSIAMRTLRTRKKAEEVATSSELHMRSILDNISDGVVAVDSSKKILLCNPAAEKLVGENAKHLETEGGPEEYGLFAAESLELAKDERKPLTGALRGQSIYDQEYWLRNPVVPQGRYISVSCTPIKSTSGETVSAVMLVHDITEKKLAHENLIAANKELDSFCYSISHDLRAPLRSISGFSKILLEDYGSKLDDEATRISNVIVKSAERMGRLIDDLLKFSRISKQSLSCTQLDLSKMFRSVAEKILMEEPLKVELEVEEMPTAFADPDLIKQVAVNLISNAIKYSSKEAEPLVQIGASLEKGETIYYVKDNGVGFNMNYYAKLFEVFQRLHSEKDFEGTGVGLSIVHRIITRHGGRVWAESEPGKGAAFYFTIPPSNE